LAEKLHQQSVLCQLCGDGHNVTQPVTIKSNIHWKFYTDLLTAKLGSLRFPIHTANATYVTWFHAKHLLCLTRVVSLEPTAFYGVLHKSHSITLHFKKRIHRNRRL